MLANSPHNITNLDKLTYAGNLENLKDLEGDARYIFVKGDITDVSVLDNILRLLLTQLSILQRNPTLTGVSSILTPSLAPTSPARTDFLNRPVNEG